MEENSVLLFGNILLEDFDEVCRCCLSSNPLANLFEVLCEGTPLVNIFYSLFGTQPDPNDDLPKKLCETCIGEVIRCYNFKKRYEASEATLRNMIAIKVEDVPVEITSESLESSFEEFVKPQPTGADESGKDSSNAEGEPQLNENIIVESEEKGTCNKIEKIVEQKIKQTKIFTCSCEETFASQLEFHQHRESTKHHLPRDHQCKICGKLYTKYSFRYHVRTHEGVKRSRCDHCGKQFASNKTLRIHMRIHTGERPHVCEFCERSFIRRYNLKMHRRIHTGEKPYLCAFCGKSFALKATCDVHMRIHKDQKSEPLSNFVCDKCGMPCRSQTAYKLHLYKHGLGERQVNKDGQHQCRICKKLFASYGSLYCHMRTHIDEKQFLCNECGKRFRTKSVLKTHSLVHSGEKSFACQSCDKKFAHKAGLEYHQRAHKDERPYACHLCPKTFRNSASLGRHFKIHSGERPYVCQFCDRSFGRKNTLDVHVRTHTGEKPYKCDECSNMFGDARSMRNHKERKHKQT